MSESNQPKGSVYDMPYEDYERLESAALTAWRMSYPKFAVDADGEEERGECSDTGVSFTDARDCYTDGYRTGYLIAAEAASSTPEPAVSVACSALARAMGLPADHPQGSNIAWLAGRAVALLEPAAADRAAWAQLVLDQFAEEHEETQPPTPVFHRYMHGTAKWALAGVVLPGFTGRRFESAPAARIAAAEAIVAASTDRYPAVPASHPAEVAAPPGEQWVPGAKATITGIHLRVGEAVTLIEASSVTPGCWYVYLRNGGIALYPKQDLKPLPAPPKGTP